MDLLVFTPSHMNLSESSDIYQFLLLHFRIYKTLDDTYSPLLKFEHLVFQ